MFSLHSENTSFIVSPLFQNSPFFWECSFVCISCTCITPSEGLHKNIQGSALCHTPPALCHQTNIILSQTCILLSKTSCYPIHLAIPDILLSQTSCYPSHLAIPAIFLSHTSCYPKHLAIPDILLSQTSCYPRPATWYPRHLAMSNL